MVVSEICFVVDGDHPTDLVPTGSIGCALDSDGSLKVATFRTTTDSANVDFQAVTVSVRSSADPWLAVRTQLVLLLLLLLLCVLAGVTSGTHARYAPVFAPGRRTHQRHVRVRQDSAAGHHHSRHFHERRRVLVPLPLHHRVLLGAALAEAVAARRAAVRH